LIKKLKSLDERIINEKFINYVFSDNGNEISLFFDKKTFILNGWQTFDLYQNLSITYISPTNINNNLEKNLFKLPKRD
jgi:outer membrane lipoprotein-sorting protein